MIVREYLTRDGVSLYRRWVETLDLSIRARVEARVLRFEVGNLGDHKLIGGGVWEARLDFGPGCRFYFGKSGRLGSAVLVLLVGGDKQSQRRDVVLAISAWSELVRELKHGKTN